MPGMKGSTDRGLDLPYTPEKRRGCLHAVRIAPPKDEHFEVGRQPPC
jgi:hypothetical protein